MLEQLLALEELHPATLLGFVEDRLAAIHARANYLGPTILPARTIDDVGFEYIAGSGAAPVAAHIVEYDSPSPSARRVGRLDRITGDLVTAKAKLEVNAKTLLKLNRALSAGSPEDIRRAVSAIYDDVETVLSALAARVELMRWQALTTGQVTYAGNGVTIQLDYQLPGDNRFNASTPWTNLVNSTPLDDLMEACDTLERTTGVRPTRAVCHPNAWSLMVRSRQVRDYAFGAFSDAAGNTLTFTRPVFENEMIGLLEQLRLPRFAVYGVQVQIEDPLTLELTTNPLVPPNVVVLLPPANVPVGETLFGPTPSEVLNTRGVGNVLRQMTEAPRYVVLVVKEGDDPGRLVTRGEVTAVPTLPGIRYVGVLTVATSS